MGRRRFSKPKTATVATRPAPTRASCVLIVSPQMVPSVGIMAVNVPAAVPPWGEPAPSGFADIAAAVDDLAVVGRSRLATHACGRPIDVTMRLPRR